MNRTIVFYYIELNLATPFLYNRNKMVDVKKLLVNISILAYLAFFSLPIVFIWYPNMWSPAYLSPPNMFAILLRIMTIFISPWAMLAMIAITYKKGLKLQIYLTTILFMWSIILQVALILFLQYQNLIYRYYPYPYLRPD